VCPITSPVWSVLFPSIGALVTDTGGILSHPAIIAREYGLPAVVGTGNGTLALHDGQLVTVDGTSGIVQVMPVNDGDPAVMQVWSDSPRSGDAVANSVSRQGEYS
jgi:phosphoenolpyruvate synthase/pyruvate phosphate dikinase